MMAFLKVTKHRKIIKIKNIKIFETVNFKTVNEILMKSTTIGDILGGILFIILNIADFGVVTQNEVRQSC